MLRMDFWSRFHRLFHFSIDSWGICFDYKGDEVIWLFPWKRKGQTRKFYSVCWECVFHSLKEIDKLTDDYWEYEHAHPYEPL